LLTGFSVEGFGPFQHRTEVSLSALNIVFGKNNSGKTSLVRSLLFMRAGLTSPLFYALADGDLEFAPSFRELGYAGNPHPRIRYSVEKVGGRVDVSLQAVSHMLTESVARNVSVVTSAGLLNIEDETSGELEPIPPEIKSNLNEFIGNVVHIRSARPPLSRVYETRAPRSSSVSEIPYLLASSGELQSLVADWFASEVGDVRLVVEKSGYAFRFVMDREGVAVNLAASGRGLQAVFPIVVIVKAMELGMIAPDLLIVEEPEAHLHPSMHVSVGELMANAASHAQVLVETHSENLILRLRRKVAAGNLLPRDVKLFFVDEAQQVEVLEIDSNGAVEDWPVGVFEYDVEEARAIIDLRLGGA
jgi:hypothetical protein